MAKHIKSVETPSAQDILTSQLLGEYVRARRTQQKLSIEEAAAFCGVAKDTFMKVEHGQETVQVGSLLLICKGLGIKLKVVPWENEDAENSWF